FLFEPYEYLIESSGKGIRRELVEAFQHWLRVPEEIKEEIAVITEMLHNSSLMFVVIDDIEDNSDLRRGKPCAHLLYGISNSINSANLVYFIALKKALMLNHPLSPHIFAEQLIYLHRGQGLDIYWRSVLKCPNEDEYTSMVIFSK
ncbi:unnamed protein product, partial [Protopolystoma xenopodis]